MCRIQRRQKCRTLKSKNTNELIQNGQVDSHDEQRFLSFHVRVGIYFLIPVVSCVCVVSFRLRRSFTLLFSICRLSVCWLVVALSVVLLLLSGQLSYWRTSRHRVSPSLPSSPHLACPPSLALGTRSPHATRIFPLHQLCAIVLFFFCFWTCCLGCVLLLWYWYTNDVFRYLGCSTSDALPSTKKKEKISPVKKTNPPPSAHPVITVTEVNPTTPTGVKVLT